MMSIKSNQYGFSLVEVIIATSILIFLSLGFNTFMVNQFENLSGVEDKISKLNFTQEVRDLFQNSSVCRNTFVGSTMPTAFGRPISNTESYTDTTIAASLLKNITVKDAFNTVMYDPYDSSKNSYDNLTINSISLFNVNVAPGYTGLAKVILNVSRNKTSAGGADYNSIEIPLALTTDSSGNVIQCGYADKFGTSAFVATPWNGSSIPFPVLSPGYTIPFTGTRNNSTGLIKINTHNVETLVSGCYGVSLTTKLQLPTILPGGVDPRYIVSFYKTKDGITLTKLAHFHVTTVGFTPDRKIYLTKSRISQFDQGDKFLAKIVSNELQVETIFQEVVISYVGETCNH